MLQQEAKDETNRVRQGVTGHNVWLVLAVGTAGVILVLLVTYMVYFAGGPNPAGGS